MLSLLFYVAVGPQDDPVSRFEKYMRSATSMKVDMELRVTGTPHVGKGFFQAKKPDRILWAMKWGSSDFSFSINEGEGLAIERGNKTYREYGDVGRLFIPDTDLSNTPEYGFPLPLISGSLKTLLPDNVDLKPSGKESIEGTTVDSVRVEYDTSTSHVTLTAKVDAKGRLVEIVTIYGNGPNAETRTLSFRNYRQGIELSNASFALEIPKGFNAQTLPADAYPINVYEQWPQDGWMPLSGAPSWKDHGQKPLFVAIGDPNCEVSRRATEVVANLATEIAKKGGASLAISPFSQGPKILYSTIPNYYDPTGKVFSKLRTPGTPIFFMISPKGRVTRVWYGFEAAQAGEFTKDVLEWVDPNKGG